jgi:hypothetical protein
VKSGAIRRWAEKTYDECAVLTGRGELKVLEKVGVVEEKSEELSLPKSTKCLQPCSRDIGATRQLSRSKLQVNI